MSRLGKKPIPLPAGVNVSIATDNTVTVKGPKGQLNFKFHPNIAIKQEGAEVLVERPNDERLNRALHGTVRAVLNNMVVGVSAGFQRTLLIEGVGYKGEVQGEDLVMFLGYSHEIRIPAPQDTRFEIPKDSKGQIIHIFGIDKQVVGELAAYMRGLRPPEPYLGKGVRYSDEVIRRKAGKAGKGKK
jgi:large subunit ribosomal protein L6